MPICGSCMNLARFLSNASATDTFKHTKNALTLTRRAKSCELCSFFLDEILQEIRKRYGRAYPLENIAQSKSIIVRGTSGDPFPREALADKPHMARFRIDHQNLPPFEDRANLSNIPAYFSVLCSKSENISSLHGEYFADMTT
jgi:hypothetical protein